MKARLTIIITVVLNIAALAGLSLISLSARGANVTETSLSFATISVLSGNHQFYLSQGPLLIA